VPEDEDLTIVAAELRRKLLAGEIDVDKAASAADEGIRKLAGRIVEGQVDPMRGALAVYTWAWMAGAWDDDDSLPELQHLGAEFLQLSDAMEFNQDDPHQAAAIGSLIQASAKAVLDGIELPIWRLDNRGRIRPPTQ
jgi:hypothetical protein